MGKKNQSLTDRKENIVDIHCSLGRGFHEKKPVIVSIRLCLLYMVMDMVMVLLLLKANLVFDDPFVGEVGFVAR